MFDERLLGDDVQLLPLGLDGDAWAYRAGREFVKVRRGEFAPAAYLLPMYLREQGLAEVVAPTGPPSQVDSEHWVLRYPWHEGTSLWSGGLTDEQWVHYGRFLGRLHAIAPPPDLPLPGEGYATTAPARIRQLEVPSRLRAKVAGLTERVEELAARLTPGRRPHVICHADIHPGNLLASIDGGLRVVDWDAPILAPRERDLMFVFSGDYGEHPINPHRESLFRTGYGPVELDETLLAYYINERRLDDIAEFVRAGDTYWLNRIVDSL